MSVKILGGLARGFTLATPKTESTRPTSVMLRRKLFDSRQNLEGYCFVDLFAGSGAMGLEALSRGADKIVLVESNRIAQAALKENAEKIKKYSDTTVDLSFGDAIKWLERNLPLSEETILFIDPPYEQHPLYEQVLNMLVEKRFAGEVWLESDRLKGPKIDALTRVFKSGIRTYEHSDHFVLVGKVL